MALNFLVIFEGKEVDERLQEAGLNDRRLVLRVDRDIANTCGGRKDEGQVGRLEETKEGGETIGLDYVELVLLVAGKIAESKGRLALNLETGTLHKRDKARDKLWFGLS